METSLDPASVQAPREPDGLALPRSFSAGYGSAVERGLCLGGGGLFFVAWQVGYLHALTTKGVRLDRADRVIGTSAGSIVASSLVQSRLNLLHAEISILSRVPTLVGALAPAGRLQPSQDRALAAFLEAQDAEPSTIRAIGHAALAASAPGQARMRRNISLIVGRARLRADALRITCTDAFTGERCVLGRPSGLTYARAVAASSAVPGVFPPQPVGDRFCMDGGASGSGTHLDLLSGARRVLVLALSDGTDDTDAMMTQRPGDGRRELADLRASGSEVVLRVPEEVDLAILMAPAAVPRALAMGADQGSADAEHLAEFWNGGRVDDALGDTRRQ
ncbi:MAG: patatin-like phospholipase family protein [Acidimicrobiales bacterium]